MWAVRERACSTCARTIIAAAANLRCSVRPSALSPFRSAIDEDPRPREQRSWAHFYTPFSPPNLRFHLDGDYMCVCLHKQSRCDPYPSHPNQCRLRWQLGVKRTLIVDAEIFHPTLQSLPCLSLPNQVQRPRVLAKAFLRLPGRGRHARRHLPT